jgi:hypothetical protein
MPSKPTEKARPHHAESLAKTIVYSLHPTMTDLNVVNGRVRIGQESQPASVLQAH